MNEFHRISASCLSVNSIAPALTTGQIYDVIKTELYDTSTGALSVTGCTNDV